MGLGIEFRPIFGKTAKGSYGMVKQHVGGNVRHYTYFHWAWDFHIYTKEGFFVSDSLVNTVPVREPLKHK